MSDILIARLKRRLRNPQCVTSVGASTIYPPVTDALVTAAEARLGFRLPPLLHRLYTQVGNGGYGPGYGIIGLEGGAVFQFPWGDRCLWQFYFDMLRTSEDMSYLIDPSHTDEHTTPPWPPCLLPICDWGCWMLSCIDCSQPGYPVIDYLGYGGEFFPSWPSFDAWIEGWLNGAQLFDGAGA